MVRTTGRLAIALLFAVTVSACGSTGNVSHLRDGADHVDFVQHGRRPLGFSAGVIDSDSFWATYGPAVSAKLGGSDAIDEWAHDGAAATEARKEQAALMVDLMYDRHDLAESVNSALIADLAAYWGYAPGPGGVVVIGENTALVDPSTAQLVGVETVADLVLMVEVSEVRLTQRFSARNTLLSGVSLGTATMKLTVESPVNLLAFRRQPGTDDLLLVWSRRCGADYTSMKGSEKLTTLWDDPAAMSALLDEARDRTIAHCRRLLAARGHHR